MDTQDLSRVRLFIKRKSRAGHIIKMAWERQTGAIPNFFKSGTINGASFNNTGIFFIEQEIVSSNWTYHYVYSIAQRVVLIFSPS